MSNIHTFISFLDKHKVPYQYEKQSGTYVIERAFVKSILFGKIFNITFYGEMPLHMQMILEGKLIIFVMEDVLEEELKSIRIQGYTVIIEMNKKVKYHTIKFVRK